MAADPAQAVDTLVDEIADLEIDEDLLHPASGSVGDSEEEEAVQAAAPAPAPAAAANRGRGRSAKGAGAPGKGRGGKAWPALTLPLLLASMPLVSAASENSMTILEM